MINLTDRLASFRSMVEDEIATALFAVSDRSRTWTETLHVERISQAAIWFGSFFRPENQVYALDEEFVRSAFEFASMPSTNRGAAPIVERLTRYFVGKHPSADAFPYLKRGLKLFLLRLWDEGFLGFPTGFSFGAHFVYPPLDNELFSFCRSYGEPEIARNRNVQIETARRIHYYVPRVLFASNWKTIGALNLNEYAQLHAYIRASLLNGTSVVSASPIPWTGFLTELYSKFPETVAFSEADLQQYRAWNLSRPEDQSFAEFQETFSPLRAKRAQRKRNYPPRPNASVRALQEIVSAVRPERAPNINPNPATISNEVDVRLVKHHDALTYIRALRGMRRARLAFDWREGPPVYPGREQVKTFEFGTVWLSFLTDYLRHRRQHENTETHEEATYALNHLADYLLLYLPWYFEIFPDSKVDFPSTPAMFQRFPFVRQGEGELRESFPLSLFDFIEELRTTAGSIASARRALRSFFAYLSKFCSDADAVGEDFANPILATDIPHGAHPTKTNKAVIPRAVEPVLLGLAMASEAFGEYLAEAHLDGRIEDLRNLPRTGVHDHYDCSMSGYVPIVLNDSRIFPVLEVPAVFTISKRAHEFTINGVVERVERDVVHCTTLRLCIAAVDNGLRFQSMQWLDINEWDRLNAAYPASTRFTYISQSAFVFDLYVSVDKRKEDAWDARMMFPIRAMLAREEAFQRERAVDGALRPIPYESGQTRFGPITPLFRSDRGSKPVSDEAYSNVWTKLMTALQGFYPQVLGHSGYSFVRFSKPQTAGKVIFINDTQFGPLAACELGYLAICTPHSVRSTFITNNRDLGPEVIAGIVGHAGARPTRYYMNPSKEEISKAYSRARGEVYAGTFFLTDNSARGKKIVAAQALYVRSDRPDSALQRAMREDRSRAVREFGFIRPVVFWALPKNSTLADDGPELLQAGPMHDFHFFETHICPVNRMCPPEVVEFTGQKECCGLCPLAMKCIEHITAIAAKMRKVTSQIQYYNSLRTAMQNAGEPPAAYASITDDIARNIAELDGWFCSHEMLSEERERLLATASEGRQFFSTKPEMLAPHLKVMEKVLDDDELAAQRIFDVAAYPAMSDRDIQLRASIVKRKLMRGVSIDELGLPIASSDVVVAAHALRLRLSMSSDANRLEVKSVLAEAFGETA